MESIPETTPAAITDLDISGLPNTKCKANKGIDVTDILDLRDKGLSTNQIAKVLGCSHVNISQRLRSIDSTLQRTTKYRKNKALVLAYHQQRISERITDADIKKAKLIDKVKALSFLNNAERLEEGKSTTNVAYADMVKAHRATMYEIDFLEAEYGKPRVDKVETQGSDGGTPP